MKILVWQSPFVESDEIITARLVDVNMDLLPSTSLHPESQPFYRREERLLFLYIGYEMMWLCVVDGVRRLKTFSELHIQMP